MHKPHPCFFIFHFYFIFIFFFKYHHLDDCRCYIADQPVVQSVASLTANRNVLGSIPTQSQTESLFSVQDGDSELLGPFFPVSLRMVIPVCRITNGGCGR
jgi:hypothetical protein